MFQKILGVLRLLGWFLLPSFRSTLTQLEAELFAQYGNVPKHQQCTLLVGYTRAGKSTFAQTLAGHYATVATDAIHEYLNRAFVQLQDNTTMHGTGFWPRQYLTYILRRRLTSRLFRNGCNVLSDSCNLRRCQRQHVLQKAKRLGYSTCIIWVQCDPAIHGQRLEQSDVIRRGKGLAPSYKATFSCIQRPLFEAPTPDEADVLTVFQSPNEI